MSYFKKKTPTTWEIINHGVDNSTYLNGVCSLGYDDAVTGTGNSAKEAFNDALEELAEDGWAVDEIKNEEMDNRLKEIENNSDHDLNCYVSVLVRR